LDEILKLLSKSQNLSSNSERNSVTESKSAWDELYATGTSGAILPKLTENKPINFELLCGHQAITAIAAEKTDWLVLPNR
jgi:hypothetical protein